MALDEKTCCFTGHRPKRVPWLGESNDPRYVALRSALWERITESYHQGYTRFLSGMAQGVDLMAAELVLRLGETEPEVTLVPVIPYPGQASHWRREERERYQAVLRACGGEMVVVSPAYSKSCFFLRNRYLVDHSAKIIGVYDGIPSGGTHQTLDYARQRGLEMELLYIQE